MKPGSDSDPEGEGARRPTPPHAPIRRAYARPTGRRDVDQFERVSRLRVGLWSMVGAFLGFLFGTLLDVQGATGVLVTTLTTLVGWACVYFGPLLLMRGAAQVGSTVYNPSGRSTPRKREYSLAESHVARGQYQAAVDAFEVAILDDPTDVMPYIRVARIQRDNLGDDERAAHWFKKALTASNPTVGMRTLLRRELLELFERRMRDPARAVPMLARIAEEEAHTADGSWAATELARIKLALANESDADA